MFEDILLEQEQERLLSTLVEITRNVPHDLRGKFIFIRDQRGSRARIPRLPDTKVEAHIIDVEVLARAELVELSYTRRTPNFYVTPKGFKYYEHMKRQVSEPTQRVETAIRDYLNADQFRQRYPKAFQKWAGAEELLWESDSEQQLTTVGHLCREAMQEFATALVDQYQPAQVDKDKAHTVARLRAVLEVRASQLGSTEKPFLDALLTYWGTVSDLIQRQEHGGQKESR